MILSPETVLHAMSAVAGGPAPLHAPEISGNEWQYVKECLDTEWVSTAGAYVGRFEDMLTEFTGAGHAIATVNGTAALHACLLLAGVKPGDEVIVPALTFVATANAVFYAGAVPHFADAEEATLGLDPAKLDAHLETIAKTTPGGLINKATGRRISAVVCVHTFGHA
ncbi:MAG: aminotransferase class I/II-fold pyridoxal phosphate-dependent enzyme, partial [Rhodospirillales bacterium]|nr:aminotransferase class I/II-fold pyridoxal phosphate-dependent enzyme [Rhodospirillales bacterium]